MVKKRCGWRASAACGLLLGQVVLAPPAGAQAPPADRRPDSPAALAELVLDRFVASPPAAFDSVYPEPEGRTLVASARTGGIPLERGEAAVLRMDGRQATLLLTGVPKLGNSGDETIYARMFSGLYRAVEDGSGWRIEGRIPMDQDNRIVSHAIAAVLEPGRGLRVRDTLEVSVRDPDGFWAFLNHRATIESVTLDGSVPEHRFSGGLLWVRAPRQDHAKLVLDYTLDVVADSAAPPNSGRFEDDFGHVRHQYFWHPFFDFDSPGDRAHMSVTVASPADYHVTTSIPQVEEVRGGERIVRADTHVPTFALTLMYDREWVPVRRSFGSMELEILVTPGFRPSPDSIAEAVAHAHGVLSRHFGEPPSRHLTVAQARARPGSGWHFRSNDLIGGGAEGAQSSRGGLLPRAWLGHEVAHGWTRPTGAGANFLSEGWAAFAEALILEDEHGPEVVDGYWENQRNWYGWGGYEGAASLLEDSNNGGVSYNKGAWLLRMLRDVMGDEAFSVGFAAYMSLAPDEPADVEAFSRAMSRAAGRDLGPFLRPWLTERSLPDLEARVEGDRLIVGQRGAVYPLSIEVEIETGVGPVHRRMYLSQREDTLSLTGVGAVSGVLLDPDRRLLLRRHRGEVVRFELDAPRARKVALAGDFARGPIEARRSGDTWQAELPLAEGRYVYWWLVDDEFHAPTGNTVIEVRALADVANPYPRE